ncbi:low molecular weight phosphatase family protein [Natronosalvus rutilus]|uniref:Low molecular weight phosphatase family protein n=1 Tax=Natronosalvus rutilus TaxID=2953753 RepID=A0A9E7SS53_9EURY|nr:low molecular weight phosphatase family protein [Natronosalvus rutilus]UTF52134.1 low molecular weight phosphatase family protein [Natronosalvus rutilus]
MKVAFVCVGNAGRSQIATAFAERERDEREMDVEIVTGGVNPADSVHEEVIVVMQEDDIDISDRTPRKITPADIEDVDYVVTMGCSVERFRPEEWDGEARQWELAASAGETLSSYRAVRDEIRERVKAFFDEIEQTTQL